MEYKWTNIAKHRKTFLSCISDYISEIGRESLAVILKEVNDNVRMFWESFKCLYEPE